MDSYKQKYFKYKKKYLDLKGGTSKSDQIKKVLPLVAAQAQFVDFTLLSDSEGYMDNPVSSRIYIDIIAKKLKPNEWIWISENQLETDYLSSVKQRDGPSLKPRGLFLSKGEWLFSEASSMFDKWITKVTVNYDNILVVTNKEQSKQLVDKYGVKKDGFIETTIDWAKVANNYQGVAVVPNLYDPDEYGPGYEYGWNAGWDVSTLALWSKEPIIESQTVLNTKDYLTPDILDDTMEFDIQMKEIINLL